MGRMSDFSRSFVTPVVQPTARDAAERWIRALAGSEPVQAAEAEAEVRFRKEELINGWIEPFRRCDFLARPPNARLLPHWRAGVEYTKRMCLAYGDAAVDPIPNPHEFESFLEESVAILSDRIYRKKLLSYDGLEDEALKWAMAQFQEFVWTALVIRKELLNMKLAAWVRQKDRLQRTASRETGDLDGGAFNAETAAIQPAATRAESPEPTSTPACAEDCVDWVENGNAIAAAREVRLQEFVRRHNTTIAAVWRTARVAKADMQRWRKSELKSTSVMAGRIEDVLSGKTPLA